MDCDVGVFMCLGVGGYVYVFCGVVVEVVGGGVVGVVDCVGYVGFFG